jgi:hypothetical protein
VCVIADIDRSEENHCALETRPCVHPFGDERIAATTNVTAPADELGSVGRRMSSRMAPRSRWSPPDGSHAESPVMPNRVVIGGRAVLAGSA